MITCFATLKCWTILCCTQIWAATWQAVMLITWAPAQVI